jgi:hypothetical protein
LQEDGYDGLINRVEFLEKSDRSTYTYLHIPTSHYAYARYRKGNNNPLGYALAAKAPQYMRGRSFGDAVFQVLWNNEKLSPKIKIDAYGAKQSLLQLSFAPINPLFLPFIKKPYSLGMEAILINKLNQQLYKIHRAFCTSSSMQMMLKR